MVATSGLTRSKGRVSQAGKSSTVPGPRKVVRSWAVRSASRTVAVTTSIGRRSLNRATPARTKAVAASGTASAVDPTDRASIMAGSWRSREGRDRRLTCARLRVFRMSYGAITPMPREEPTRPRSALQPRHRVDGVRVRIACSWAPVWVGAGSPLPSSGYRPPVRVPSAPERRSRRRVRCARS